MGLSSSRMQKTVVIIGCGPAGQLMATALAPFCTVVVVSKSDCYMHSVAGLRAMTTPGWEDRATIPLDQFLKNLPRDKAAPHRLVVGEAVGVSRGQGPQQWTVKLESGADIKADAVVMCTGSGQDMLGRSGDDLTTASAIKGYFKGLQAKVAAASKVVVVGGGPVGIEMVGELRHYHPRVEVTLVHNGAALVSNAASMAPEKFQKSILEVVEKGGVKVLLNDSVDMSIFKEGEWVKEGPINLKTKSGKSIADVSLVFKAIGVPTPSGKIFESAIFKKGEQLDAKGYFKVDNHFQVSGLPGIFAIGDCHSFPNEAKTIVSIMMRHKLVVQNVVAALQGKPEKMKVIPPQKQGVMMVPFGPKAGRGYFGKSALPNFMVVAAKSGDLFLKDSWKRCNAKERK